jgi:hypothetical protein
MNSLNITTIPTDTLETDLQESKNDISCCELALLHGLTSYSGGSVQKRLDDNKLFVKVISEELDHRKNSIIPSTAISTL